MKILAIDTSTDITSISVSEDDIVLSNIEVLRHRDYSTSLILLIKNALDSAKLKLEDMDGIAIGIGPGSFTGLRIGITTVKGFNLSLKKNVVGIPSLDAIALNGRYFDGEVAVIVDAKKNQIYACTYKRVGGIVKRSSKYMLATIDKLLPRLKTETLFLGDGVNLYRDLLQKQKNIFKLGEKACWYPKAYNIARLALDRFKKGDFDDADRLTPMYLYSKYCTITKSKIKSQK